MTRRSLWQVEISLWLLTLLAVLMARRLFDSWDYAPLWLILAMGGHATAAVTRRQRWPLTVAATASVVLLIVVEGLALYSDTLWLRLLPSTETLRQASTDVAAAWEAFGIVEAPTPATGGFLLVGGAAIWLTAFIADAAALRAKAIGEALLPALVVLAFIGALGTDAMACPKCCGDGRVRGGVRGRARHPPHREPDAGRRVGAASGNRAHAYRTAVGNCCRRGRGAARTVAARQRCPGDRLVEGPRRNRARIEGDRSARSSMLKAV